MNNLYKELNQKNTQNNVISNWQQYANKPEVLNLLNQYRTPKDAFYALAKQRGINPEQLISLFKGFVR